MFGFKIRIIKVKVSIYVGFELIQMQKLSFLGIDVSRFGFL